MGPDDGIRDVIYVIIVKLNRRCRAAPHEKVVVPNVRRQMIHELDCMITAKWLIHLEINAAFVKRESS